MESKQHHYLDKNSQERLISDDGLNRAIEIKLAMQSDTGRANWSKLCHMLRKEGFSAYPGEGFRTLVRYWQHQQGLLPTKEESLTTAQQRKRDLLVEDSLEIATQKRELQIMKREFNKLKRNVFDEKIFRDNLIESLPEKIVTYSPNNEIDSNISMGGQSMVVNLSDLHIGATVNTDGINNKYNVSIALKRLNEYLKKVVEHAKLTNPDSIYIVNLGDTIEGIFMRYNQSYTTDLDLSEQQSIAIQFVTMFIAQLQDLVSCHVYYTGIGGNHDRSNGNKKDNIYGDSFSVVLNTIIEIMSKSNNGLTFIKPDSPVRTHLTIGGSDIAFVHGDLDKLNNDNILGQLSQYYHKDYKAIVGGHLHSMMIKENNGLVIQSGSLIGPTDYSDSFKGGASISQVILDITETGEITPFVVKLYS